MFGFFTDAVENALTVGEKLITLDAPTKREIAKLADTRLTVAAIAACPPGAGCDCNNCKALDMLEELEQQP